MAHDQQKIYTKTGDLGETSLIGGMRVSKAELRLNCYGTVDELNSVLGVLLAQIHLLSKKSALLEACTQILGQIQSSLFDIGSHLASEDESIIKKMPKLNVVQITDMENWIDQANTELTPLKNFILPGGGLAASYAHLGRTVARRAERVIVALSKKAKVEPDIIIYINRLSDFLFVISRYLNHLEKIEDVIWSARTSKATAK